MDAQEELQQYLKKRTDCLESAKRKFPFLFPLDGMQLNFLEALWEKQFWQERAEKLERDMEHLLQKIEHRCIDANCEECDHEQ
jgi:hypothetical protein